MPRADQFPAGRIFLKMCGKAHPESPACYTIQATLGPMSEFSLAQGTPRVSFLHKISAVIIAFNEEVDIPRALSSLAWCDEVLVVDSGSTDRTVEVCEAYGAKVLRRDFIGYGDQKAWAVTQAAHDWIIALDADEQVPGALRDEIQSKLASADNCCGYYIPITTVLWDQVVRAGHRHTKPKLRLFDRRFGNFRRQLVHESVALEGRTGLLREPMYNFSCSSIADYFDKFNRYTSLAAIESFRPGERSSFLKAVVTLPLTFLQFYFLKGFVWDGSAGFAWSLFSSLYPAVKQFKLSEFHRAFAQQQLAEGFTLIATSPTRQPRQRTSRVRQTPLFSEEFAASRPYKERAGNG
jgi:glycosyltransferase involved in cell wall biosynthesis